MNRKYGKALLNLGIALAGVLLALLLLPRVLVYFLPFVVGWIIAAIASPFVRFFEEKVKIKRKAGSAFVIVAVIAFVVLILYLICAVLVQETASLIEALPDMWESAEGDFEQIGQRLSIILKKLPGGMQSTIDNIGNDMNTYVGDLLGKLSSPTIAAVGSFAKRLPSVIIGVIMALLSAYFFVADKKNIQIWLRNHTPGVVQKWFSMIRGSFMMAVGGYLKAQLKIEFWMYLFLVIGLSVLKVNYALLIALGIAVLDFLPFFGTGTIMVPWAIIKILSADYKMAIGLLILWGVGQLGRQLIQPKIVGDSVGMEPLPTLFLLYIGYKTGGVLGMVLAVPIGLIVYALYTEGAFETTTKSIRILAEGINRFRKLEPEETESDGQQEKKQW